MSLELAADCASCDALCCVLPAFARSSDFAVDKPAGARCPNLDPAQRCRIHPRLRSAGFGGCVAFDCFGAGQRLTRAHRDGGPAPTAGALFALRHRHHVLWLLREALAAGLEEDLRAEVQRAWELASTGAESDAVPVLGRVSAVLRARAAGPGANHDQADLIGADLRQSDLRACSLRGAILVGARLDGMDLTGADLTGADLRGTDLRGTDLSGALFLHPSQLATARGDAHTRLPPGVPPPDHW